jgi:hypothetical protein
VFHMDDIQTIQHFLFSLKWQILKQI